MIGLDPTRGAEVAVVQICAVSKERLVQRIARLEALQSARLRQLITEMYGG